MGKAIVIKSVNFSANALAQVTFVDEVPCTGLSLNETTKNLTSLTAFTLVATKTPNNTTDNLTWASSDTSVATVADGVVTPLKGGSVTITATCGEQTATCAISIHHMVDPHMLQKLYYSKATSGSGDTIKVDGGSSTAIGCSVVTTGSGDRAYDPSSKIPDGAKSYPIYIPNGCTAIKVCVPNQNIRITVSWCDSQSTSGYGDYYPLLLNIEDVPWTTSIPAGDRTINIYTGADCFFITAYLSGGTLSQEMLDQITVEYIYS